MENLLTNWGNVSSWRSILLHSSSANRVYHVLCPSVKTVWKYIKTFLIRNLRGNGVAGNRSFPDIRMLCLMYILVYLAPSWTDLTQFVTWYPVLLPCCTFKFSFHDYLCNKLHIDIKSRAPILNSLDHHTMLHSLHWITHTFWCCHLHCLVMQFYPVNSLSWLT